jgi:myo-inositol-1-phosphate synthase
MSREIRLGVAGVGNCCSSLIQGLFYYKDVDTNNELIPGLMHNVLGGYKISDVKPAIAFDIDERKVGKDLSEAIFARPNCTKVFQKDVPSLDVDVRMGPVLDGVADHMKDYPSERSFVVSKEGVSDVTKELKAAEVDVLVSYMPVGSEEAAMHYAQACLDAGVAFINCMPVFIASDQGLAEKFRMKGIPIVGDDIKSQLGATITHRNLVNMFSERGVKIDRTYQLNTGGNSVTGNQEIVLSVDGKIRKVKIGDFIDSYVKKNGRKRKDGKDIVETGKIKQKIKCFTIDDRCRVVQSDVGALIRHKINGPIYEVTTEEGRKIKITGDHNVFTLDDAGNFRETPVKSLKEGETYITVPNNMKSPDTDLKEFALPIKDRPYSRLSGNMLKVHSNPDIKIPLNFPITEEFLQIVGLWLADGNYDRKGSSNLEIACGREPECMNVIEGFLGKLKIKYNVRSSDGVGVRINSKTLGKIFREGFDLKGSSYTKRVPEWVFGLSERQISNVLKGYLSGDGGVTGKQIRWTSVSRELLEDIQTLFLRVGINTTVFKENYNQNRGSAYNSKLGYSWHGLISSKDDMEYFMNKVGFLQDYKNKSAIKAFKQLKRSDIHRIPNIPLLKKWKIKSTTWHKHSSIRSHIVLSQLDKVKDKKERQKLRDICSGDAGFLKVKKIREIKERDVHVYDISTKPYERFICSNILVHNTDFLNMLERSRLKSKKISKTEAVQSQLPVPLPADKIHIGPSDYVPWQDDNKVCFIRIEGRKFGNVPVELELRLSIEDSPNSAGCVIDAIRCAKLAKDRRVGGPLISISSYTMKHPPIQYPDHVARGMVEEFIKGERER